MHEQAIHAEACIWTILTAIHVQCNTAVHVHLLLHLQVNTL